MTLDGADSNTVKRAIDAKNSLPGTAGFAGVCDGTLVRDVLGRRPLFVEDGLLAGAEARGEGPVVRNPDAMSPDQQSSRDGFERGTHWSFDHRDLDAPESFPAGHVLESDAGGEPRQCWSLPTTEAQSDEDLAVANVRDALAETFDSIEEDGLAVAFSGGVDSSLLAAQLGGPLYVVGFPESHDIEAAQTGAAQLDADLRVVELDHETLERAVPTVATAIGRTNAMDVSIALPLFVLAERIAADGFERVALGQGADELFGGYAKVANAPDDHRVEASTVRGARREVLVTLPGQFERDVLAIRAAGVEPVTPLAHDRVVRAALALDDDCLVRGSTRKWALRAAAREWLPPELYERDKKALQYGSLVSRELDRLARQAGFKRRMDDHVGKYIESLV